MSELPNSSDALLPGSNGRLSMAEKRYSVGQLITGAFKRHGAPYSKRLSVHNSCVNALAWSGDGRWLASGGDGKLNPKDGNSTNYIWADKRILLWDFNPVDELSTPFVCAGPRRNVLCLAFCASNSYVFSGGVDEQVLQYDVARMTCSSSAGTNSVCRRFSQHTGSIRAISPHPRSDHLLLTGSEDGNVILHDTRVPQRSHGEGCLSINSEVTGVQFHPVTEHFFVTSDEKGNCNLRDVRMAFDASHNTRGLLKYVTTLSRPGTSHLSNPEVSSLVFDHTGTHLAVTMLHYLPTIYAVWDEWPLATCSGATLPPLFSQDTHEPSYHSSGRSYVNACTIKNGSFGGAGLQRDCYYGAGSDDFRGYVWYLPERAELAAQRRELSYAEWSTQPPGEIVGFAQHTSGRRVVPVELHQPQFLLYGHKSIVNTVLFHPHEPYIVTSGIERHVVLHSPFEVTPAFGRLTHTESSVRQLPETDAQTRQLFEEGNDDARMMALFDDILRNEGTPDVFDSRQWRGSQSESDEDIQQDEDMEDSVSEESNTSDYHDM